MTCRHRPGDPDCSSHPSNAYRSDPAPTTPDKSNFVVEEIEEVGPHLVMKVRYPNCVRCSYEGNKVMVFLNVRTIDAIRWKIIDPHFRDRRDGRAAKSAIAPSPAARFPGDPEGWVDALEYAQQKRNVRLHRDGE